jgi:uncharacterized membrane protein YeiH
MTFTDSCILVGGFAFAVTGALAALRRDMDIFGAVVLAVVTAVGGGTIRDLVLRSDKVFWIDQPIHLIVAIVAGAVTFFASGVIQRRQLYLLLADALGLAFAAVASTRLALAIQDSYTVAVFIGVIGSTAGGIIRDVVCGQVPLIFHREVYATAALAGALVLVGAHAMGYSGPTTDLVGAGVALGIRVAAIAFGLSLPPFLQARRKSLQIEDEERK